MPQVTHARARAAEVQLPPPHLTACCGASTWHTERPKLASLPDCSRSSRASLHTLIVSDASSLLLLLLLPRSSPQIHFAEVKIHWSVPGG